MRTNAAILVAKFSLRKSLVFLGVLLYWPAYGFDVTALSELLNVSPQTGRPVQSIEELIPLLPIELRANFTFVYDSRSPFRDSISPKFPRVILFSNDARMALTFTGDPSKPGYNILEALTFNNEERRFSAQAFVLPAAQKMGVELSAENRDCARCHGTDTRPIYDSYPLWPGFYGSVRDTFPGGSPALVKEKSEYIKFLNLQANRGVYRGLVFPAHTNVSPYLDPKKFHAKSLEGDLKNFAFLPNTRLGMALTELNRERIMRKLLESPVFREKEKSILAELLDCGPTHLNEDETAEIQSALHAENEARLQRLGMNPKLRGSHVNDMQELKFQRELTQIDWLARTAEVSRKDWSMAMEPGSLSFFDGILSGIHDGRSFYLKEDLIFEILKDLKQTQPATFRPYFSSSAIYLWLGYPFGRRPDIGRALQACAALDTKKAESRSD